MKQLIAQTLLALLSIAAAQNPPDGPVVPVNGEGDLMYLTEEQAAALRETWEGNVVGGENFFDDEMFQNTEDRTDGVTGGTIGGIDPIAPWEGNVVGGENYFDDEMFQNTEDRTDGVTGGTIGEIDPMPQPDAPGVGEPTKKYVRKIEPPCGRKFSLARGRGGAGGQAKTSGGCARNLR
jgi:hypothetical protein